MATAQSNSLPRVVQPVLFQFYGSSLFPSLILPSFVPN
jgi:hypothetical protein